MAVEFKLMTVEDLLALPDDGMRHELVRGELVEMPPVGEEHGDIAVAIATLLYGPINAAGLGKVRVETGVILSKEPATVLGPDVSVTLGTDPSVRGFSERLPTIVFEVASPSDRPTAVHEKLGAFLEAGVAMVVAVWPGRRELTVGTSNAEWLVLTADGVLDLTAQVPGLTVPVSPIFG